MATVPGPPLDGIHGHLVDHDVIRTAIIEFNGLQPQITSQTSAIAGKENTGVAAAAVSAHAAAADPHSVYATDVDLATGLATKASTTHGTHLPTVTTANNGQVATVVAGVWDVATAPAGPTGPTGPAGAAGTSGFIVSTTEPVGVADGTVWIQVS